MKDIDFDELDRAVSSLLGKPEEKKPSSEPVADQANAPDPSPTQAAASPEPTPPQPSPTPASTTPPPSPQTPPSSPSPQPQARPEDKAAAPERRDVATPTRSNAAETENNRTRFPITPSAPASAPSQSEPAPKSPQSQPETNLPEREEPKPAKPAAPAAQPPKNSPEAGPSNTPARPPATRRSGRFMDVVRPSSSNTTATSEPQQTESSSARPVAAQPLQSSGKVSRVGRDIKAPSTMAATAPSAAAPPPQTPPTEVEPSTPKEQSDSNKPQPQPEEPKTSSFSLFGKKSAKEEPLLTDKTKSHPETQANGKPSEDVASPFLTDAKVEKRPLGSIMSGTSQTANTEPRPLKAPNKPTLNTAALNTDERTALAETTSAEEDDVQQSASSLPPELKKDIVAVESADTSNDAENRPDTPPALPPEKKPAVKTARSASEAAASNATLSIQQQYKAKRNEPDTTPRSIYDTDEYHKPLSAPSQKKKKTHPVVWVLLIILLLAVGAGLGVAAYFLLG